MRIFVIFICLQFSFNSFAHSGRNTSSQNVPPKVSREKISGCVYMIKGMGGNIGICSTKGKLIMVDAQFEKISKQINNQLKRISKRDVDFVINTHWHGDHTDGNKFFSKKSHIIAHENVRKRLSEDQFSKFLDRTTKALPATALPVITFKDSLTFHVADEEIEVKHLPKGHTDGDAIVLFKNSKVAHVGDHFFKNKFPYIDLGSGGTVQGYVENIKTLLKMIPEDYKIIPGHGDLATHADLKVFSKMLVHSVERVQDFKSLEKSLEEVLKMSFIDEYASWGDGFISKEKWITTVYNGL